MTALTFPQKSRFASVLLKWYDAEARVLPWRVSPADRKAGLVPDPYKVWLSEIMLQQTTVATVRGRYDRFLKLWPNVKKLAAATVDDVTGEWAGLGYYARARNLHACARVVAHDHSGNFPSTEESLRALPGIGDYTAAAIAAIAFDRRAVVVDGNIERVMSRIFAIETPLPMAKSEMKKAAASLWPQKRSGDFAQSLMDLGATICTPKNPSCLLCPVSKQCEGREAGIADTLPRKQKKKDKPTRRGKAYVLRSAKGELLFERRPEKGLLGGMLGFPCTEWSDAPDDRPPAKTTWREAGVVRHTFTHFHLELDVVVGKAPKGFRRRDGQVWILPGEVKLPTVMKKVLVRSASE